MGRVARLASILGVQGEGVLAAILSPLGLLVREKLLLLLLLLLQRQLLCFESLLLHLMIKTCVNSLSLVSQHSHVAVRAVRIRQIHPYSTA